MIFVFQSFENVPTFKWKWLKLSVVCSIYTIRWKTHVTPLSSFWNGPIGWICLPSRFFSLSKTYFWAQKYKSSKNNCKKWWMVHVQEEFFDEFWKNILAASFVWRLFVSFVTQSSPVQTPPFGQAELGVRPLHLLQNCQSLLCQFYSEGALLFVTGALD